jgi:asparagine synthase (glutamine-hydrolysing)
MLETYNHLYTRPIFKHVNDNSWSGDYQKLISTKNNFTIDHVAIASLMSFGQFSENRTLFKEINRLPWLARPLANGLYEELTLPRHCFYSDSSELLSKRLFDLLCKEARKVISKNSQIYILLTGGLDSRIICGVFSHLFNNKEYNKKPICLTWGIKESRDVYYAKLTAEKLDLPWQHIPLGPENVIENIQSCGKLLGLLNSPEDMHSMLWFKNIPKDSIVVAGSFGDSIGRGEFSNLHLLQLNKKKPKNQFDLLDQKVFERSSKFLHDDLNKIHNRGKKNPLKHIQCEYWMQGYRMRNGLCHTLSVINNFANVYQMFTDPELYEFIWSIHPSIRDDEIYNTILTKYLPELSKIPWARNNKAIIGNFRNTKLKPHYHEYTKWSSTLLYDEIKALVNPLWFADMKLFNPNSIVKLNKMVKASTYRVGRINNIWLWLAGFRYYIDYLDSLNIKTNTQVECANYTFSDQSLSVRENLTLMSSKFNKVNSSLKALRKHYRDFDLHIKKKKMLKKYPPLKF